MICVRGSVKVGVGLMEFGLYDVRQRWLFFQVQLVLTERPRGGVQLRPTARRPHHAASVWFRSPTENIPLRCQLLPSQLLLQWCLWSHRLPRHIPVPQHTPTVELTVHNRKQGRKKPWLLKETTNKKPKTHVLDQLSSHDHRTSRRRNASNWISTMSENQFKNLEFFLKKTFKTSKVKTLYLLCNL